MLFKFNSLYEKYKKPFGSVSAGTAVRFHIECVDGIYVEKVRLALIKDGESVVYYPMTFTGKSGSESNFTVEVNITSHGLYWYYFTADTELGELNLYRDADGNLAYNGEMYQITVYQNDYATPAVIKGGVIYHIFVDRFAKGDDVDVIWDKDGVLKKWNEPLTIVDSDGVFRANDFYGGNLQGIIDKLPYLKDLGVTMLYLSPIFKSGSNHRYDTGDYMKIDELIGTEERFAELIEKAHSIDIQIILDGVFNHTGSDSLYFNKKNTYDSIGAYQGIKSPYYDWYYFVNYPDNYGCWWGITVTPTVNKLVDSYKRFIFGDGGVIEKWTKFGIDGWRLDVVDELDIDFVNGLRSKIKSVKNDALIIGEVWEDASSKIAYSVRRPYLMGNQLDGVMNYPFKDAILDFIKYGNAYEFYKSVMNIYENYPLQSLNCSMTFLGTHDTVRAINSLSQADITGTTKEQRLNINLSKTERKLAVERMKMASILQYVLPGVPSVYYGDEIGMEGYEDPINRKPFTWDNIDNELLSHYKALGAMRRKYKDCFGGEMNIIHNNAYLFIERSSKRGVVNTYINLLAEDCQVSDVTGVNCLDNSKVEGSYTIKKGGYLVVFHKNV